MDESQQQREPPVQDSADEKPKPESNNGNFFSKKGKVLAITGAAVLGGLGAVALAPVVLGAVGFTSAGIAAGSYAASMMSAAAIANGGGVAAGSLVAVLQSAVHGAPFRAVLLLDHFNQTIVWGRGGSTGAVGLSATASAAVASVGAGVGAGVVAGVNHLAGKTQKEKEEGEEEEEEKKKRKKKDKEQIKEGAEEEEEEENDNGDGFARGQELEEYGQ